MGRGGGAWEAGSLGKEGSAGSWKAEPRRDLRRLGPRKGGPGSVAMLDALGSLAAALWAALRPGTVLLGAVVFLFLDDFLKRR